MLFRQLFDPESSTYTYLLADAQTRDAVLIDPVLEQAPRDLELLRDLGLTLRYALDTHVHADHVTALGTLREATGCATVLSSKAGVGCADRAVSTGDRIEFGRHALEVRQTPGHTNGCVSYVLDDHSVAFTGDALLIRGSGRTDFQQGDARALWRSVHEQLFTLPDETLLYPGHDYKGRTVTSVGEEKRLNPRLGAGKTVEDFVEIMDELGLAYPKKIDVALPANLACGVPLDLPVTPESARPEAPWAPTERSGDGVPELAPEWVAAHPRGARLIDVRQREEYEGELGHVAGSELVPLEQLSERAARLDRSAPTIVICASGNRSGQAARLLLERGFERVASMRGGMMGWGERRFPTERSGATA
jgi:sulfur dioxygenase